MKIKAESILPYLILNLFLIACFISKSYAASYNNNLIYKIEARYKRVDSISAYFYQKEIFPGYSQNMKFKGYFYFERNAGMAWVYKYPFNKRQVLKNGRLYIVNNQDKKVSVINVGKERGGFPPNVVKVLGNLTKYFKIIKISVNSDLNVITVRLHPLSMQRAKRISVGFNKKSLKIKSLKIMTHQGQTIIFRYKNVRFNRHIDGSIFNINFSSDYRIIKEN